MASRSLGVVGIGVVALKIGTLKLESGPKSFCNGLIS